MSNSKPKGNADPNVKDVWAIFAHSVPGGLIAATLGAYVKGDDPELDKLSVADSAVPKSWREKGYKRHLIDAKEVFKPEYGPSHLLVLEGPAEEGAADLVFAGSNNPIRGPFVVIGQHNGTDRYLHCVSCCLTTLEYLLAMQDEWGGVKADKAAGATHAAPSSLN